MSKAKAKDRLTIERMPLAQLQPAPWNPREISPEALAGLSESIERFGCVEPIIWNKRTGHVVGGHQRLKVLAERGDAEADVVVVDLTEAREKQLNVSLNNPLTQGGFTPGLAEIIESITADDADAAGAMRLGDLFAEMFGRVGQSSIRAGGDKTKEPLSVTCPSCGHSWELAKSK